MQALCRALIVSTLMLASGARAGGILLYEAGHEDSGLANAGSAARAMDPSVLMSNPAGIANLSGTQVNLAGQLILGDLVFDRAGTTTTTGNEGGNALTALPGTSLFISHWLDERSSIGFGMYSNFGLALDYDDDWTGRYFVQDTAIIGLSFQPTYAYRFSDDLAVGIGPRIMYGIFRTDAAINNSPLGVGNFEDGQLEYRANDVGYGYNLGLLYHLSERTRLGLAYTSEVKFEFEDKPSLHDISNPALAAALQRLGLERLALDVNVPQTATASLYHQIDDKWAVLASIGWQDWSEFAEIGIDLDSDTINSSKTADRKYQDTWHASLGGQRQIDARLCWNFGIAYDSTAVDDEDRTLDNPMNETWRLATGINYQLEDGLDMNLSYTLLWLGDMQVEQTKRLSGQRTAGEFSNAALHVLGGGVVWRF